jgi:hypothetical protein
LIPCDVCGAEMPSARTVPSCVFGMMTVGKVSVCDMWLLVHHVLCVGRMCVVCEAVDCAMGKRGHGLVEKRGHLSENHWNQTVFQD